MTTLGCDGDSDPEAEDASETIKELMVNDGAQWVPNTIMKDGYDVTDQFAGFTLKIGSDQTYEVTNALETAWPKNTGTWEFADTDGKTVRRDDGTLMNVSVTETTLQLVFMASVNGRMDGVDGEFTFNLVTQ